MAQLWGPFALLGHMYRNISDSFIAMEKMYSVLDEVIEILMFNMKLVEKRLFTNFHFYV